MAPAGSSFCASSRTATWASSSACVSAFLDDGVPVCRPGDVVVVAAGWWGGRGGDCCCGGGDWRCGCWRALLALEVAVVVAVLVVVPLAIDSADGARDEPYDEA